MKKIMTMLALFSFLGLASCAHHGAKCDKCKDEKHDSCEMKDKKTDDKKEEKK